MDHESAQALLGDRHGRLEVDHHELTVKHAAMMEEYEELVKFRDDAQHRLAAQDVEGSYREKALEVHHERIEDFQNQIQQSQAEITECKHELDVTIVKYTSA
jgi:predicted  nucleic acid-binding Zn-ribbon protein